MAVQIRDDRRFARPLRRSLRHRALAGVCGGIAEWIDWDVTLVRAIFVVVALVTSVVPVAFVYVLLALILPEDRSPDSYLRWWADSDRW